MENDQIQNQNGISSPANISEISPSLENSQNIVTTPATNPQSLSAAQNLQSSQIPSTQIVQGIQPEGGFMNAQNCQYCNAAIPKDVYFCPNCGKKLKDPPPPTTVWKQISLYTFAIIAPPFGILPGIKYIMHGDDKAKMVGYITIALTLIAFIITTIWTFQFFNAVNQQMSQQIGSMGGGF